MAQASPQVRDLLGRERVRESDNIVRLADSSSVNVYFKRPCCELHVGAFSDVGAGEANE